MPFSIVSVSPYTMLPSRSCSTTFGNAVVFTVVATFGASSVFLGSAKVSALISSSINSSAACPSRSSVSPFAGSIPRIFPRKRLPSRSVTESLSACAPSAVLLVLRVEDVVFRNVTTPGTACGSSPPALIPPMTMFPFSLSICPPAICSGAAASFAFSSISFPSRRTLSFTSCSGFSARIISRSCAEVFASLPSSVSTRSPSFSPAFSAGESFTTLPMPTLVIFFGASFFAPSSAASWSVSVSSTTPR